MAALRRAAELGAAYIDVELKAAEAFFQAGGPLPQGAQLIVSSHNYEETPPAEELLALVDRWVPLLLLRS